MTNIKNRVREQGVALMMTLGILSLILILAMSFAYTARTTRMLSETNAEMTRARLFAKGTLDLVIANLGFTFDASKYIDDDTAGVSAADRKLIFPATSGSLFTQESSYGTRHFWACQQGPDGDDVNILKALSSTGGLVSSTGAVLGNGLLPELSTSELTSLSAGWKHTKDFNGKLIERYTFIVVDESYKIDPRGVITINHEPYWGTTPAAGYYDLDADGTHDTMTPFGQFKESAVKRPGVSPQEIRLHTLFADNFWQKLPVVGGTAPPQKGDWFSWRHIAAGLPAMTDTATPGMLECYFPYSYDVESYMYRDYSAGDTEMVEKHRLDLWNVPWDSCTTWFTTTSPGMYWLACYPPGSSSSTTVDQGPSDFLRNAAGVIQAASVDPTGYLGSAPALGQFTVKSITQDTVTNLIDFGDADNEASRRPAGQDWDLQQVGCEEQPYINEIALEISHAYDLGTDGVFGTGPDGTGTDDDPKTGTFSFNMFLELAEIYGTTPGRDFQAEARIAFELKYFDADGNDLGKVTKADIVITFDAGTAAAGTAAAPNAYTVVQSDAPYTYTLFENCEDAAGNSVAPPRVKFTITKLEVNLKTDDASGTVFADYARPVDSTKIWAEIDGWDAAASTYYVSVQTDDPRCNTISDFWKEQGVETQGYSSTTASDVLTMTLHDSDPTLHVGKPNTGVNPFTGSPTLNTTYAAGEFDAEDATIVDPVLGLCNAYIANKSNFTFWELGAVHRGEPWRTINLRSFTKLEEDGTALTASALFRSYAEGDAALLTQLKLGGFEETRGKVNANSPDDKVWFQLLNGLTVGADYDDPGGSGTAITVTEAETLAGKIATYNQGAGNDRLLERGQFVELPNLTDGTYGLIVQNTDRLQEELIGKLANLLTVRQNLFTVMVTAQAVKDTDINNAKLHNTITYDGGTNYCNIMSEQRLMATVYRDAFTNQFRVVRVEYLED